MTVKRQFSCNLCGDSIADYKDGIGIYWEGNRRITSKLISDTSHHICNNCYHGLKEMFANLAAISAERVARSREK